MKDKVPEMEYVFCDTGDELQETYECLDKLGFYLEKRSFLRLIHYGSWAFFGIIRVNLMAKAGMSPWLRRMKRFWVRIS